MRQLTLLLLLFFGLQLNLWSQTETKHAEDFGFSPSNTSQANCEALNLALAGGGRVTVSTPGTYLISGTIYLDSETTLEFGQNVLLKRCRQNDGCTYNLFVNRHAWDRTYDHDITIRGLNLDVDHIKGPDNMPTIIGLQGTLAFFYIRNLSIEDLTLTNLNRNEFGLQICTFENLQIRNAYITGEKDGIHLGRGRKFTIEDCQIGTSDDPIALNGHDYYISNPEMGWIEDGEISDCYDLPIGTSIGFFTRFLAGSWCDWRDSMPLQCNDAVVSDGRIYRLMSEGDNQVSTCRPTHLQGAMTYSDGCRWLMQQDQEVGYTAGVRNVRLRNIHLQKDRDIAFSLHFDNSSISRSFYPEATPILQSGITFEQIDQCCHLNLLMDASTPVDTIRISNSHLASGNIWLHTVNDCTYDTVTVILHNTIPPCAPEDFLGIEGYPGRLVIETSEPVSPIDWSKMKLVTIGDSQTSLCGWQPILQEFLGLEWSREETVNGVDGHDPMAMGGTHLKPGYDENGIMQRGLDAVYYNPDAVIIYAGQNDPLTSWLSSGNTGKTPLEQVAQELPVACKELRHGVSAVSALRGLIEYLKQHLPDIRIYLMTHVPILGVVGMNPTEAFADKYPSPRFATSQDVIDFEMSERYPKDDFIRAVGQYYDLPVIDAWLHAGITFDNVQLYYDHPAGDCTQVHLNAVGDRLLGLCAASYLLNAPYRYDASWSPPETDYFSLNRIITPDTILYTIDGRRLDYSFQHPLPKGVYILKGEKVIVY